MIPVGILICGLNGSGKSTLGRLLAEKLGYRFIDNEDLYFPKDDPSYLYSGPRSKEEVVRHLEELIEEDRRFVFASVKGNYGDKLPAYLDHVILIEVPMEIRSRRVRDRSWQKFGDRVLRGGDLYETEQNWYSLTDSRPDHYVTQWLDTVQCPVIRIDGTLLPEENLGKLLPLLS